MHELTRKIAEYQRSNPNKTFSEYDSIITAYLKECAENLLNKTSGSDFMKDKIWTSLGLEKKEEVCKHLGDPKCIKCGYMQEPQKEVWCEHSVICEEIGALQKLTADTVYVSKSSSWKFCPICGTPRPKQSSLVEELAEELYAKAPDFEHNDLRNYKSKYWINLSETAISFLKSKGVMK